MKPLLSLLNIEKLEDLASRSNYRYGKDIVKNGVIKITKSNVFNVIAEVESKNKEPQTTTLSSTPKGLRWKCSCTGRKDLFCHHCAAVGIFLVNNVK